MLAGLGAGSCTRSAIPVLEGFETIEIEVSASPWLVALADDSAKRAQGLMGVTDLGGLDGMLFVFEADTESGFWMKDTLIPLDIAFFDDRGVFVDVLSMVPCESDESDPCPVYRPTGPYRYALEARPNAFAAIDAPFLDFGG